MVLGLSWVGREKAVELNVVGDAEVSDQFDRAMAAGDFD
jgi:hypothetical protein